MALYITGSGNILPHPKRNGGGFSGEPDYTEWIDVRHLRRMSRIIKMGVTAAAMALKDAGIEKPDGIITGTGYGCLEDTGNFLSKLITNKEQSLNPTPFIQSTHNTIGSQIALLFQCQGYNQTFTHNAFSFEHSLLDAILHFNENPGQKLLVGGADEITEVSEAILKRFSVFDENVHGEGAAYFVLSDEENENTKAVIESVRTIYKPDPRELETSLKGFLTHSGFESKDIDLVLLGKSGDEQHDALQDQMITSVFPGSSIGLFKHICGEYPVASSFALWLATKALNEQSIPEMILSKNSGRSFQNVLIYNQYFATHHTLILLRACHGMQ